jgi:polysaccharide export outer membrane protein
MLPRSYSRISPRRWGGSGCLLFLLLMMLDLTVQADEQQQPENAQQAQKAQQAQTSEKPEYIVGPNDVLGITVYDQPQLSRTYSVQADGSLTFPLIGRVKVGGLSTPAIESELRQRLSQGFLKSPQVGVIVEQYRSQQIFVIGEVRQPGNLQFTGSMTVLEALARVGSTTERAGTEAIIMRPPSGAPPPDEAAVARAQQVNGSDVIRIDLQSLQSGEVSQNAVLQAGDTIFVPRINSVFVSGQVTTAGEYPIRKGMTVRQVLALAGGVTDRGSTGRIQIIRKIEGQDRTISANLQDVVQPNDTIIVRERFF